MEEEEGGAGTESRGAAGADAEDTGRPSNSAMSATNSASSFVLSTSGGGATAACACGQCREFHMRNYKVL